MSIAVILTVFNRKEKTLKCLESLALQRNMPDYDVFMCDDGSTDGTSEAVLARFPNVKIIPGSGNLFWSRGMAKAMAAAVEVGYDYYLMVNDDVEFFDTMWDTMFEPFKVDCSIAVVGYTIDRALNTITYGGRNMIKTRMNYIIGPVVDPSAESFNTVDVANWNCFLLDKQVVEKVGLIDNYYEHGLGDFDYCLRMKKRNLKILVAKQTIGYCENNSRKGTYLDGKVPRLLRLKKMLAPNGFPVKSWCHFVNRHYGIYKYRNAVMPYIKNLFAILMRKDIV